MMTNEEKSEAVRRAAQVLTAARQFTTSLGSANPEHVDYVEVHQREIKRLVTALETAYPGVEQFDKDLSALLALAGELAVPAKS